ncbi:hypothetical protein Pmani_030779 [Petrolisthes manimaculis]|uniref:Uncharacterized protein n=1 Tax=Petrolisthes manimaculis TaxID=1843537 RepID=A0AAE1NVA3_9EUCA|nr:hypothetical protein Pmani_030779 [Petrolisthes manimaculis]
MSRLENQVSKVKIIEPISVPDKPDCVLVNATRNTPSIIQPKKGTSNLESGLALNSAELNLPDLLRDSSSLHMRKGNSKETPSPPITTKMLTDLVDVMIGKDFNKQKLVLRLQKTGTPNSKTFHIKRSPVQKLETSAQVVNPQTSPVKKPSGHRPIPCEKNVDESFSQPTRTNLLLKLPISSVTDTSIEEGDSRNTRHTDQLSKQSLSPASDLSSVNEELSNNCDEEKRPEDNCSSLNIDTSASDCEFDGVNYEQEEGENENLTRSNNLEIGFMENSISSIDSSSVINKSTSRKRKKSKEADRIHQKCKRFKIVSIDMLRMTLIPTESPTHGYISDINENVIKRNYSRKKQKKRKHSKAKSQKRSVLTESNEITEVNFKDPKYTSNRSISVQTNISSVEVPQADWPSSPEPLRKAISSVEVPPTVWPSSPEPLRKAISSVNVAALGYDPGGRLLSDHRENYSGGNNLTGNVCSFEDYVDMCIENPQKESKHSKESDKDSFFNDNLEILDIRSTNEKFAQIKNVHGYSSAIKTTIDETGSRLCENREHEKSGRLEQGKMETGITAEEDLSDVDIKIEEDLSDVDIKIEEHVSDVDIKIEEEVSDVDIKIEEEILVLSSDEEVEIVKEVGNDSYKAEADQNNKTDVMERGDSALTNFRTAVNHIKASVHNPCAATKHIMSAIDCIRAAAGCSQNLINDPIAIANLIKAALNNPSAVEDHIKSAMNKLMDTMCRSKAKGQVENFHPNCTTQNPSLARVSGDSEVCLIDASMTSTADNNETSLSDNNTYSTGTSPVSRTDNVIIERNNTSNDTPEPLHVETHFSNIQLSDRPSVNANSGTSSYRMVSEEAEKNLWDSFVKSEINDDINEQEYVFDSDKEKEIVNYTALWLDGLPEFVEGSDLYDNLKRAMKKINLDIWEQDKRIVYNWEVNLRRLAVYTLGIPDPDSFTKNICLYMSEIPRLSDFVKYVTSLAQTNT